MGAGMYDFLLSRPATILVSLGARASPMIGRPALAALVHAARFAGGQAFAICKCMAELLGYVFGHRPCRGSQLFGGMCFRVAE